jgi:hypothetical protein
MSEDLMLRGKWTFRAGDRQIVLTKKINEGREHVLMKALLWALYLPDYPDLRVEFSIPGRFKPDLVQLDAGGSVTFWAEAGKVSARKMRTLVSRYRRTHFVFAKWDSDLASFQRLLDKPLKSSRRRAPVDLISFPRDSAERFVTPGGIIDIHRSDLTWLRRQG